MVEFQLTDEQESIRTLARSIGSGVVSPAAAEAELARGIGAEGWGQLLDTGLVAPVAVDYGGGGLPDPLGQVLATEELAYADAAVAASACWSGNAALLIGLIGTSAQCEGLLPSFSDPLTRGSVAHLEGFGRAPSEYQTTIRRSATGWAVTGRKVAVPFANQATRVVAIGVDPDAGNRLRAAVITGTLDPETISSTGIYLGLNAASLATVRFEVNVEPDDVLGPVEGGDELLSRALSRIRLTTAALCIGTAQRAREYASSYATERVAFGKPIAAFQSVSFMMAEAQMQIDAARMQMWRVATELDHAPPTALERAVSMAVSYASSVAASVTRDSVQVLGGHGFIADHPVERWYRAAAGLSTLDFDPTCSAFAPAL